MKLPPLIPILEVVHQSKAISRAHRINQLSVRRIISNRCSLKSTNPATKQKSTNLRIPASEQSFDALDPCRLLVTSPSRSGSRPLNRFCFRPTECRSSSKPSSTWIAFMASQSFELINERACPDGERQVTASSSTRTDKPFDRPGIHQHQHQHHGQNSDQRRHPPKQDHQTHSPNPVEQHATVQPLGGAIDPSRLINIKDLKLFACFYPLTSKKYLISRANRSNLQGTSSRGWSRQKTHGLSNREEERTFIRNQCLFI